MVEKTNTPDVEEAFRILSEATENDLPMMSESMFVEHILPMLSAPPGSKVDLSRWLDVAGTPLRGIAVHDSNSGVFLFRVPPLMRSMPTLFQKDVNYSEIIFESQAKAKIVPTLGDSYLTSELSKVRTGATLLDVSTAQEWNIIRKRYNLPLIPLSAQDGSKIESSSKPDDGQLVVSDDDEPLF